MLSPENQTLEEPQAIDVWIVELGAGTGNLSYLLLRALSLSPAAGELFVLREGRSYPVQLRVVVTVSIRIPFDLFLTNPSIRTSSSATWSSGRATNTSRTSSSVV